MIFFFGFAGLTAGLLDVDASLNLSTIESIDKSTVVAPLLPLYPLLLTLKESDWAVVIMDKLLLFRLVLPELFCWGVVALAWLTVLEEIED